LTEQQITCKIRYRKTRFPVKSN